MSAAAERRIEEAIKELAYLPNRIARSLKMKRTMTLGMVIPDITNPYFPEVVKGVDSAARAAGFNLILANAGEDALIEWEHLQTLRGLRCDGVVLIPAPRTGDETEWQRRLESYPLPLVFVDRQVGSGRDVVVSDNLRASGDAVRHLLRLGHKQIALLDTTLEVSSHRDRAEGYVQAMKEAGGSGPDSALMARVSASAADGFAATQRLLELPNPPTAMFIPNSRLTIGALQAIAARGLRCPEDISIISFDDYEWQEAFRPRLTTIAQPGFLIGQRGAEVLIARITDDNSERAHEQIVLSSRLLVRESCGVYAGR